MCVWTFRSGGRLSIFIFKKFWNENKMCTPGASEDNLFDAESMFFFIIIIVTKALTRVHFLPNQCEIFWSKGVLKLNYIK